MKRRTVLHQMLRSCAMPYVQTPTSCTAPETYVRYVFLPVEIIRSLTCVCIICDHYIPLLVYTGACTNGTGGSGQAGLSCEDNTKRVQQAFTWFLQVCLLVLPKLSRVHHVSFCLDALCDLILLCAACSKVPASLRNQNTQHTPPVCM